MVIGQANSGGTGGMQPIAVRTDAYGNSVPDPTTDPEGYRRWHAQNLAAQRGDNSDPARQNELLSADIQADLDRRQGASTGLQDTFNSIQADGGPLASNGTTTRPSLRENLERAAAANPQPFGGPGTIDPAALRGASDRFQLSPESQAALGARTSSIFDSFDMSGLDGGVVENPSDAEVAAGNAADAIGGAPRVDMGLADRRLGEYQESLGMSREVIDRLLNGPSTAERLGSQTLRTQLALARSARGGPGAVQQALSQAQQQAPELQATATEQARQEELSKLTAAGNVASNFAQAALGARGQDVNIASKNVDSGLQVKDMITRLTGTQLELDQRNTELLGQMARDLAALDFDWATLSAQQASAALDRYMQIYGIDQNYAAQIKALEQSGKITGKDIFNGIIGLTGGAATLGAAALGKPPI
jgi:hypothetical protein